MGTNAGVPPRRRGPAGAVFRVYSRPAGHQAPRSLLGFLACVLALALAPLARSAAPAAAKPNILFILADDYGIGEVGCYGSDHYRTPNLDALARGAARARLVMRPFGTFGPRILGLQFRTLKGT